MTQSEAAEKLSFGSRFRTFYKKHQKFFMVLYLLIGVYVLLLWLGSLYKPFSPGVLLSKESADNAKEYILDFGAAAPIVFVSLQVAQVIVAPIPGQATGFAGGYVFGWQLGTLYTMIGLTLGSLIVFALARKFGRSFVERFNGPEAIKDFEGLFLPTEGKAGKIADLVYGKPKEHGLLTFFFIMLLPALPDDLVCFVAGLTRIPIWQLLAATILGRFPGMLVLSLLGDGVSNAQKPIYLWVFIALTVVLTAIYFWKKEQIEGLMRRTVGAKGASEE